MSNGIYTGGIDFPPVISTRRTLCGWTSPVNITFLIRDEWGNPMHGVGFVVQVHAATGDCRYSVPDQARRNELTELGRDRLTLPPNERSDGRRLQFLRPAGFSLTLADASAGSAGTIRMFAFDAQNAVIAQGACVYTLRGSGRQRAIQIAVQRAYREELNATARQGAGGSVTAQVGTRDFHPISGTISAPTTTRTNTSTTRIPLSVLNMSQSN
jgi:hypothetical protein